VTVPGGGLGLRGDSPGRRRGPRAGGTSSQASTEPGAAGGASGPATGLPRAASAAARQASTEPGAAERRPHPPDLEWALDPSITFLNHGSFGACPLPVLDAQASWRRRMEAEPVGFLARELEGLLAVARAELAEFVGAGPDDLAFVRNATTGVNTVLRSLRFAPGDELLVTDHAYNASINALRHAAARDGARVVFARLPFPVRDTGEALEAVLAAVSPRTRLALIDHVTSPTALVLPVAQLVAELDRRGVDTLVDGAHGPGMLPVDLDALGAAYYTGNCHKWLCAPKGSAFLHVRHDRQAMVHPLAVSHGANSMRTDASRFRLEFDWTGTDDPTAWLSVAEAIHAVGGATAGGWPEVMRANRGLALEARDLLLDALGVEPAAPACMLGSMAAIRLPGTRGPAREGDRIAGIFEDDLRSRGFEVPVMAWPLPALVASGDLPAGTECDLFVRISAQRYNHLDQYARLAEALADVVAAR